MIKRFSRTTQKNPLAAAIYYNFLFLFSLAADSDSTKRRRIPKSRYDSISSYLSECPTECPEEKYNDVPLVHDEEIYKQLLAAGIQEHMAKHVAHLFIR